MLYWLLGYEEEAEANERQKHLKHLLCRQIEQSKLKLNKVNLNEEVYEMKPLRKRKNKKIRTKTITV